MNEQNNDLLILMHRLNQKLSSSISHKRIDSWIVIILKSSRD
jgi:hypothetical protein